MQKKRILLIDEDVHALENMYNQLEEMYDFNVKWLKDADNVIEIIEEEDFDAIILDIMMPVPAAWSKDDFRRADKGLSTGSILFQKIRKLKPNMPILIYSAKGGIEIDSYSDNLRKPELTKIIVENLNKLMKDEN